ncbi:unnamed protein product [Lupinus luteus]|uniref:Uncharacterized protein n=1 Tax=Lupinus luteus TaxID=3873 RepID=A0AAV1Y3K2_LUPLU
MTRLYLPLHSPWGTHCPGYRPRKTSGCYAPQAQHTPSCSSRQFSGGVCALGGEPSTRPDQQAPGQLKVSTIKVAQAGA